MGLLREDCGVSVGWKRELEIKHMKIKKESLQIFWT